jgi:hypothetical protein
MVLDLQQQREVPYFKARDQSADYVGRIKHHHGMLSHKENVMRSY